MVPRRIGPETMAIREQQPGDDETVRRIIELAFKGHPHSDGREQFIIAALRDAGALTLALIGEEDGEIVGQVAFSPVTIEGALQGWYGLGPVAVRPDRQGRGIGQALIRAGLDHLRILQAGGCVLLGAPDYYRRFGFAANPRLRLEGPPPEYFLTLPFEAEVPSGTVEFHAVFDTA